MKKLVSVIILAVLLLVAFLVVRGAALKMPFAEIFASGAMVDVVVLGGAAEVRVLSNSIVWIQLFGS